MGKDGSMSADFQKFLSAYSAKRPHVDSWETFSTGAMFDRETEAEAWAYWRWRILRAQEGHLNPFAVDYALLRKLARQYFSPVGNSSGRSFVVTSNCDQLHTKRGTVSDDHLFEIHGSLGFLQCSKARMEGKDDCLETLYPIAKLEPAVSSCKKGSPESSAAARAGNAGRTSPASNLVKAASTSDNVRAQLPGKSAAAGKEDAGAKGGSVVPVAGRKGAPNSDRELVKKPSVPKAGAAAGSV